MRDRLGAHDLLSELFSVEHFSDLVTILDMDLSKEDKILVWIFQKRTKMLARHYIACSVPLVTKYLESVTVLT